MLDSEQLGHSNTLMSLDSAEINLPPYQRTHFRLFRLVMDRKPEDAMEILQEDSDRRVIGLLANLFGGKDKRIDDRVHRALLARHNREKSFFWKRDWLDRACEFETKARTNLEENDDLYRILRDMNPYWTDEFRITSFGRDELILYQDQYRSTTEILEDIIGAAANVELYISTGDSDGPHFGDFYQRRIKTLIDRLKTEDIYPGDKEFVKDLALKSLEKFKAKKEEMSRVKKEGKLKIWRKPHGFLINILRGYIGACNKVDLCDRNPVHLLNRLNHEYFEYPVSEDYIERSIADYFEGKAMVSTSIFEFTPETHAAMIRSFAGIAGDKVILTAHPDGMRQRAYFNNFESLTHLSRDAIVYLRSHPEAKNLFVDVLQNLRKTIESVGFSSCKGLPDPLGYIDHTLLRLNPEEVLDKVSVKLEQEKQVTSTESISLIPVELTSKPNLPSEEEETFATHLGFILTNYPDLKERVLGIVDKIWTRWGTPADNGMRLKLLKGLAAAGLEEFWSYWEKGLAMLPSSGDYAQNPVYAYCRDPKDISSQTVPGHTVAEYIELLDSGVLSSNQQRVEQILRDSNFLLDPRLKSNIIFFGLNKLLNSELHLILRLIKNGRNVKDLFMGTMERSVNLAWEITGHNRPMSPKEKVMVFETLTDTTAFTDVLEAFSTI